MKKLLLTLLLCIGVTAFACDCGGRSEETNCCASACDSCGCEKDVGKSVFRGGCMQSSSFTFMVPRGMKKTWNVTSFEHGFLFDLYEEKIDEESEMLMVVGKMPLVGAFPEIDVESVVSVMIEALGMGTEDEDDDDDESDSFLSFEPLPVLITGEFLSKRFQLSVHFDEEETEVLFDINLLAKDGVMYVIATGMASEYVDEDELFDLTEQVMYTVDFK